ncbi:MAG: NUDIX hydrolase [Myxococcales bacterium]|nr:NUDIX hydrolase [Myxococcales bacterium]
MDKTSTGREALRTLPNVAIEVLDDRTDSVGSGGGFIKVRRYTVRTRGAREEGQPFAYDVVDRTALDAVIMVLYATDGAASDDPLVCVRSALRPPVGLRSGRWLAAPETQGAMLWELPAGLIEPSESHDPVRETASRETREETGYAVDASAFETLGAPVFLTPGLCAEKIHFVCAEVDRDAPREVTSTEAVERGAECVWISLREALALAAEGVLCDAKTELGLRRLSDRLSARDTKGRAR